MISYYKKKNYKLKKLDLRNSKKIILGVESNESIKCFNIRMIIFQSIFLFKKKNILIYVHKYIYIYKKIYTLKENEPCVILNSNIAVMMNVCTLCKIWIGMFNDVVKKFPNEVLYFDTLFLWNDITRKKNLNYKIHSLMLKCTFVIYRWHPMAQTSVPLSSWSLKVKSKSF